MALQHLRSNTASKRPTAGAMSDGQIAINTNATSPGLFFKDAGGAVTKVGPVHVGTSAPNSSPAGSTGNSVGEQWLDTSGGGYVLKIWDGSAWRSEAGEFVDAAGDTMTGDLVMNNANIVFEGSTDDDFETTLTVVDPTADRTITLPNVTGTVVTTGDTGTVTSTMIADGTIVNADVNASAAIAGTKISPDFGSQNATTTGTVTGASLNPTSSTVPTNGVYLPAANSVGISTNGTGRLFVDASGNVGIGAASITNLTNYAQLALEDSNGGFIDILDDGVIQARIIGSGNELTLRAPDTGGEISFDTNGTDERLRITSTGALRHIGAGTSSSPAVGFNGSAPSNSLVIDSTGKVGLGTSSPGAKFDITESANVSLEQLMLARGGNGLSSQIRFLTKSTGGGNTGGAIGHSDALGGLILTGSSTSVASAQDVVITSAGSVGVGTTEPNELLHVNGTGATVACRIRNDTGTAGQKAALYLTTSATSTFNSAGIEAVRDSGSTDALAFIQGNNEKARIDGSGRLLVGTTSSPSAGQGQYSRLVVQGYVGGNNNAGYMSVARGEGAANITTGETLGVINFTDNTGDTFAQIIAQADADAGSGDYPGRLVFSTTADGNSSPDPRMTIKNDGAVCINRTAVVQSGNKLAIAGDGTNTVIGIQTAHTSGTLNALEFTDGAGTNCGEIVVDASANTTSYSTSSDYRLKENVTPIDNAISRLSGLNPCRFNFISEPGRTFDGFLAHEAQAIVPEAVNRTKDQLDEDGNPEYQTIDQSKLVPLLTAALQEAIGEIESLKARVAALESA